MRNLIGILVGGTVLYFSYTNIDRNTFTGLLESLQNQVSSLVLSNINLSNVNQIKLTQNNDNVANVSSGDNRPLNFEFLWNSIVDNKWVLLFLLCLWICFIYLYYQHKNSVLNNEIFEALKEDLKSKKLNDDNYVTEDYIVTAYSSEYNLDENYFRSAVLPALQALRKKCPKLKIYEQEFSGKMKTAWYYSD